MKDINLLPKEYKRELKLNTIYYRIIALTAIIFLFTILLLAFLSYKTGYIKEKDEELLRLLDDNRFVLLNESFQRQEYIEQRKERLTNIIQMVDKEYFITEENLSKIFETLPNGIDIRSLEIYGENVRFIGRSDDRNKISEYTYILNAYFDNIMIISLSNHDDGGFEFILDMELILSDQGANDSY